MPRGMDHIVHAARSGCDCGALQEPRLEDPRAQQASARLGHQNQIIQTPDTFIELLNVAAPEGIGPSCQHHFSSDAFNREFLARTQGLSMLVLKGPGVPDAQEFRERGIGDFELYEFEREGRRPRQAADPNAPDTGFFTCRHRHPPGNFWNAEFQKYANGMTSVAGVVLVANEPERHRAFMEVFAEARGARLAVMRFAVADASVL